PQARTCGDGHRMVNRPQRNGSGNLPAGRSRYSVMCDKPVARGKSPTRRKDMVGSPKFFFLRKLVRASPAINGRLTAELGLPPMGVASALRFLACFRDVAGGAQRLDIG